MFIGIAITMCGCSNAHDDRTICIFIPMNYTGWVNIVFRDSASSVEPLTFDNGYVYFITKDPQDFRVKSDMYAPGKYSVNYYYYNTDTTIKLSCLDYPKNNILYERTIGSRDYSRVHHTMLSYSFYVSKEPLDDSKVSIDMLPKNSILQ